MILTLVNFISNLVYLFNRKFTNIFHVSGVAETIFLSLTFLLLENPFYIFYRLEVTCVAAGLRWFIKTPFTQNSNNTYDHKENFSGVGLRRKPSSINKIYLFNRASLSPLISLQGACGSKERKGKIISLSKL